MESDAKIQQYLLLAKTLRGTGLGDLITRATSDPGLFAYGELLDQPNVQELKGTENAPFVLLLELFCYGVWLDYQGHAASLPPLSPQQQHKLKQLTAMSLATSSKVLSYASLMQQLDIRGVRELEDFLITDCFYAGILRGKLDQRQSVLQVHDARSRDVRPEAAGVLAAALGSWVETAQSMLLSLERQISSAGAAAEAARVHKAQVDKAAEDMRKHLKAEVDVRGGDAGITDDGVADLMEDVERRHGTMGRPKSRRR